MTVVPGVPLNDGNTIPQLGFGTYQIDPAGTMEAVLAALKVGYRHVDTAQMYRNEQGVGDALRASGLAREDVYLTTKLNNDNHEPASARRSFDRSLDALGVTYVDLFLIHWPLPTRYGGDFVSTWQVLQEFQASGRARSIGVSNFQPAHLDAILEQADIVPAVNQIEAHPYLLNDEVVRCNRKHGIVTEAWPPVARGALLEEPVVREVARSQDRTPAQVVIRWHLQRGHVIFPKTVTPHRMWENFQVFDFELSEQEMGLLTGLDRGPAGRIGPHPDRFDWIP